MRLSEISSDRVILILGAPRSGTSWLAKMFDSHPNVLYRHEPDTVVRAENLPWMCDLESIPDYLESARSYLGQLMETATVKSAGSLPFFAKSFEPLPARVLHRAMIYGLRAASLTSRGRRMVRNIPVPDMFDPARHPELRLAIKSVSSRGRARLFAEALPEAKVILIVRDAWGQIASMRRGDALGKFEGALPVGYLADPKRGTQYGLTPDEFVTLPAVEQLAWNWVLENERAIDDLKGLDRVKVVRYQDLCEQPMQQARALFEFTGLSWEDQTEAFLRQSTSHTGRDRYYAVFRDTAAALYRWRQELSPEDQQRIHAVVRASSLAGLCPQFDP